MVVKRDSPDGRSNVGLRGGRQHGLPCTSARQDPEVVCSEVLRKVRAKYGELDISGYEHPFERSVETEIQRERTMSVCSYHRVIDGLEWRRTRILPFGL